MKGNHVFQALILKKNLKQSVAKVCILIFFSLYLLSETNFGTKPTVLYGCAESVGGIHVITLIILLFSSYNWSLDALLHATFWKDGCGIGTLIFQAMHTTQLQHVLCDAGADCAWSLRTTCSTLTSGWARGRDRTWTGSSWSRSSTTSSSRYVGTNTLFK